MKKKMDLNFSYAICQYFIWKKSSREFFATVRSMEKRMDLNFSDAICWYEKKVVVTFFLRLLLPPSWFGRKEVVRSFSATFFPRTASCLAVVWLLGSLLTEEIVPCCSGNRAVNANMPPGSIPSAPLRREKWALAPNILVKYSMDSTLALRSLHLPFRL